MVEKKDKNRFVIVIAFIAALAGLLFGYDTGVISGAILFIKDKFGLTDFTEEMTVSSVLLGAVIGAAISGVIADKFGRKKSIIVTAVIFSIAALGSAISANIDQLIICRLFIGVAIGIASFVAPLYISEISPPKIRGALVSFNQLMITCGIVLSYIADYLLSADAAWRWMFAFGAVPAIILGIGMFFLPYSPRWLVAQGRRDEAKAVLERIGETDVDNDVKNIEEGISEESGNWSELFSPWLRPVLIVGIVLAFIQQATGINTVIYYAPTIFEFAGFESHKISILATAGVGVVNVLMTIVAILFIDRVGRKPLLYIGLTGMILSLGALGLGFQMAGPSAIMEKVTIISLAVYIASFAISLGPIFWLIIAEIYPLKVRGRAMSLATVANWTFNLIVASTFLTIIEKIGKAGAFWLYGIVAIAGLIFCIFFVPETKGHSLEAIEKYLKTKKPLVKLGK
ncbi:MAG: sugar porter family MFS transporter [Candidatus Kappaea frigidicola]|nr:sugar porter family MFS transporter [Candidatus Kappaea frigidicola]